ncbi:hypothetical protein KA005_52285, partial [bacterium]|nr:hypothetical protein [bacterium]
TKIVPIGVWDMNALASKSISTGVAHGDIRAINAIIKHDAGTHNYDLNYDNGNGSAGIPNGAECSTTSVELYRVTGGFFDSTTFSATSFTIDNAAAVDKGAGLVGIPITGHVYNANDSTIISGTTNYDGLYDIVSKTANEIVIAAPFIPETFAGAETVSWNRGWVAITYVS